MAKSKGKTAATEGVKKQSFWLRILPEDVVVAKKETGSTEAKIKVWSMQLHTIFGLFVLMSIAVLFRAENVLLALAPLVLIWIFRSIFFFQVRDAYKSFKLQRHYEFLYFFSLIVPHLAGEAGAKLGLYKVLTKMEDRMKPKGVDGSDGILKDGVNRLIIQMTNNPGDIEPFQTFARECSGTELAIDISVALYDFQNNSEEQDAIIRLKNKVNKELALRIEDIVDMKLGKFRWYSERLVMCAFILVLGILGAAIWEGVATAFNALPS